MGAENRERGAAYTESKNHTQTERSDGRANQHHRIENILHSDLRFDIRCSELILTSRILIDAKSTAWRFTLCILAEGPCLLTLFFIAY
jgi:hypothetical protein